MLTIPIASSYSMSKRDTGDGGGLRIRISKEVATITRADYTQEYVKSMKNFRLGGTLANNARKSH